jgi:hypothetical protein
MFRNPRIYFWEDQYSSEPTLQSMNPLIEIVKKL